MSDPGEVCKSNTPRTCQVEAGGRPQGVTAPPRWPCQAQGGRNPRTAAASGISTLAGPKGSQRRPNTDPCCCADTGMLHAAPLLLLAFFPNRTKRLTLRYSNSVVKRSLSRRPAASTSPARRAEAASPALARLCVAAAVAVHGQQQVQDAGSPAALTCTDREPVVSLTVRTQCKRTSGCAGCGRLALFARMWGENRVSGTG